MLEMHAQAMSSEQLDRIWTHGIRTSRPHFTNSVIFLP